MARRPSRKHAAIGVFVVLIIAVLAGAIMATGSTVYSADNMKTLALYNAVGTVVNITSYKTDGGVLQFTPADSDVAKIVITYDFQFREAKSSVNTIVVDLSGLEKSSTTTAVVAKVYLSDGTYDLALGTIDLDKSKVLTYYVSPDDWKNFNDFSNVMIKIIFYDENGTVVNYVAQGAESSLKTDFKVMLNTSTVNSFIASAIVAVIVAIRKFAHAVLSIMGSAAAALIANSAILTLIIPLAIAAIAYYESEKKGRKLFR
ncbi:MAG: hypothetical protein GXO43_09935 [Crenarchaeota archaeon]|nr:hypothetical protein [Thermoproteota archaeon]